jgi:hypothetical protein
MPQNDFLHDWEELENSNHGLWLQVPFLAEENSVNYYLIHEE